MIDKVLPVTSSVCDSVCGAKKPVNVQLKAGMGTQIKDFFSHLFSTADWPPRWHCGSWSDFHGWLYILSDLTIWASYFAIPVLLFIIVRKRRDIPFSKVFLLFIAFILLCGTSHLIDAIIFWWPAYRLSALIRFLTAVVSIVTVFALYKIMPLINRLRTLEQLEAEIEERKRAEQDARHHQMMQQAAEELMAKKDEFMGIASHELKTPITSVKASLQLLQRMGEKNEALTPVAPFVDKALRQVNKLTDIIRELLDVGRVQAGKLELFKTDFNLSALIKECVEQCESIDGKHTVHIKGDPQLIVHADPNRLEQVIVNLLTNAFKYSPHHQLVGVFFERLNNGLTKVSVTDYGIGIAEDKKAQIFDRFYRVENTSQYFSGVGLGLYISSEIVKRHQGEIGVISSLGKGSTFWFTF